MVHADRDEVVDIIQLYYIILPIFFYHPQHPAATVVVHVLPCFTKAAGLIRLLIIYLSLTIFELQRNTYQK